MRTLYNGSGEVVTITPGRYYNGRGLDIGDARAWNWYDTTTKQTIDAAMSSITAYLAAHPQAFAFPVITDVHGWYNAQEPNYLSITYPQQLPVQLILGDMTNNTSAYNVGELSQAVEYMKGCTVAALPAIGNHEFPTSEVGWNEGDPYPKSYYEVIIPSAAVKFESENVMAYYYDDTTQGVRYIVLDTISTVKKSNPASFSFSGYMLEFMATALETDLDVVVAAHTITTGAIYKLTDPEHTSGGNSTTVSSSATYAAILNAFRNKTTYNFKDPGGTYHLHDYTATQGELIVGVYGHWHGAREHTSYGFREFTTPCVSRSSSNSQTGMAFILVDRATKLLRFYTCVYNTATPEVYDYSYEV